MGNNISGIIPGRNDINNNNINNNKVKKDSKKRVSDDEEIRRDFSKLDNFMKDITIQDYFSKSKKESKDKKFNELKIFEYNKLKEAFENNIRYYENNVLSNYKMDLLKDDNIKNDINIKIDKIILNENSENVYKKKIIDEIKKIKNNDLQHEIKYLTILVVGRKGVGKTTLINTMLKLDKNNDDIISEQNFISYKSNRVPHLKLIEFKGIGLSKDNDPEEIGNEAVKCIREKIKNKNNNRNYNDFIHCIWYCVTSTRFERQEEKLLEKLSKAYNNTTIPIIVIYTQNIDNSISDNMEEHIKNLDSQISFIKVIAKDINLANSNKKLYAFGKKELLNETLKRCTKALNGDLINLMTQTISVEIENQMLKINSDLERNINNEIIDNFIKEYKVTLKDEKFKNYIVEILGERLFPFYKNYNKKISNKSLNLLYNSNLIKSIDEFIKYYKPRVNELIKSNIYKLAETFIDEQSSLEKKNYNMRIENKRYLIGFQKTNKIFFKRNFYYISQKYIIDKIIRKICPKYFKNYREKLDSIIKLLLKKDCRDEEINNNLKDCFLAKLEKFAKDKNIDIKIDYPSINNSINNYEEEELNKENDEEDITQISIDLCDDFNEGENKENNNNIILQKRNEDNNWFPFKNRNWNYLKEDSKHSLMNFLENNMIYQESYFKIDNMDKVLKSLKQYEKNDLINFFELQKKDFLKGKINKQYNSNIIHFDKVIISNIVSSQQFKEIYKNKINNEVNKIIKEKNLFQIDHLSIIVIGKSGVGKSTLINAMLKEQLAEVNCVKITTLESNPYMSKNIPFLRLIDTRGIELDTNYGTDIILKNTLNFIKGQNKKIETDKNSNYNDYIQCIWYCVSNTNDIEKKEIEVIEELRKIKESIPIIVVYTYAQDENKINEMKNKIKENFGNLPFISVLAESIEGILESFGLDNLLKLTLKECKKYIKGNVFKKIRELSSLKIDKSFKEKNIMIKKNIINKIVDIFIHEYNEVLNNDNLDKYIFGLFEKIFVEYLKSNEIDEKIVLINENKDLLKNIIISDYIKNYKDFYKKETKIIIDSISDKKAIEFLDEQVRKEKKEFSKCIDIRNKCNKQDFIKIIEKFLNDNFYYISQKYIIYRVLTDVIEPFTESVELKVNSIVKELLNQKSPKDLLEIIYYKKFNDLEERINGFCKNGKIYNLKEQNENTTNFVQNTLLNATESNHENHILYEPAPVPINL